MEMRAIYIHKDYNAFAEICKGQTPYEIIADVPDNMTGQQIWDEANKPAAKKQGYYLHRIERRDNDGWFKMDK